MTEAKHTTARFRITWDRGAYYVSIPNYAGGEVVAADIADDLLKALKAARLMLQQYERDATGESFNCLEINNAIAKAESHS